MDMNNLSREDIVTLRDLGVEIEDGVITLVGDVDDSMYKSLVEELLKLKNGKISYPEITILLCTYGGDTYYGFAIYELLRQQEMDIKIVCTGPVMSAGTIILMAGDIRCMSPLSRLMVHYGVNGQTSDADLAENIKLLKDIKKIYKRHSKAKMQEINAWFKADTYFSAKAALKLGLIDEVVKYAKKAKRKSRAKIRR